MEMALPKDILDNIAAHVGPEKARQCAMSTSVGGIGPLLRERVTGQGEAGINVIGVSLLYDAVWIQAWHEWGQINLQKHAVGPALRKILKPTTYAFDLTFFDGTTHHVDVWEAMYGSSPVYFLDCPAVADMVYPGPKDSPRGTENPSLYSHLHRLKQSWLVGRGALMLMKKMGKAPDIAVLSETPTFFAHHRLVKDDLQKDAFFNDVKYIFNDHTPLEYAHPLWDEPTLDTVKVDKDIYMKMTAWLADKKLLDVTSLLVGICDGVFGVAKKHERVMREMASLREYGTKIKSITNGVRRQDWQAPEFADADKLSDEQLLQLKAQKRDQLVDWAWRRFRLWPTWADEARKKLIVVWTRRITPYKRLDTLLKLLKDPKLKARFINLNIIMFVGGRIHQQDNHAQDIVYDLLDLCQKDKDLESRVLFVDNFNVWEAPILFQGADASIMMADDTREASATGFMKAQMNGAAIIATEDGAVPEFVFYQGDKINGFNVPYVNHEPTPLGFLEALEAFDAAYKNPATRVKIMRAAVAETSAVDVARTVQDTKDFYEQLLKTSTRARV